MSGATVGTETEYGRWAEAAAGSLTTEGGNLSSANLSLDSLTDRWAAFFGNVSGGIVLRDNASMLFYQWTWAATDAGEVCATTGSDFAWASAVTTTGAEVNTGFTLGNAADNATNTFTDAQPCNLDFIEADVGSSAYVAHNGGNSTFWTCAVDDGGAAQGDFAFCTNITSGTDYQGGTSNYEIMVPTTPGEVETYYFFAELE